jgi:hypothetical protein
MTNNLTAIVDPKSDAATKRLNPSFIVNPLSRASKMKVKDKKQTDQSWVEKILHERWGARQLIVQDEIFEAHVVPAKTKTLRLFGFSKFVRVILPGNQRREATPATIDKPAGVGDLCQAQQRLFGEVGRVDRMKVLLFIPGFLTGAFLTLSTVTHAAPLGDGPRGRGFRGGFAAHRAGMLFTTSRAFRPHSASPSNFQLNQERRFFHRDRHVFLQSSIWPAYWYPYGDLNDYSDLDSEPDETYQYGDNSGAPAQLESAQPATDRGPIVVVIKAGNSGPVDSSQNPGYVMSGNGSTASAGQRKIAVPDSSERAGQPADPGIVVPQTSSAVAKETQTRPPAESGPFGKFVLVSWLEEAGKDVIYVQNTETHDVQKITAEPNLDNFRIVELRRNADPKLFEAVISNGSQQGPVRFRF